MGAAAQAWREQLEAWAIAPDILAAAPESPYGFPPGLFGSRAGAPTTHAAIRGSLPDAGTLLDIGCGGGAASIPLAPYVGSLLAVDSSAELLEVYAGAAAAAGVPVRTWHGVWSAVAANVPGADVAVAANVVYNVPDIGGFLQTMTEHARHRVVIELTDSHPWTGMAALWKHFHGQERPTGPTTADFLAVITELGYDASVSTFERPMAWAQASPDVILAFNRRRLCLPVERESEIAAAMRAMPAPPLGSASTVWWDA